MYSTALITGNGGNNVRFGVVIENNQIPNAQTNSIFEESDTGKHYIWSGSAWTEVA
jgi:hypothetical protein